MSEDLDGMFDEFSRALLDILWWARDGSGIFLSPFRFYGKP